MLNQAFERLLTERAAQAADWPTRRAAWLAHIESLIGQVEAWLAPYVERGQVSCERQTVVLDEEGLGRYEAPSLHIRLVDLDAWLEPIGAVVIGAQGRVDLRGFHGGAKLVLVPSSADRPAIGVSRANLAPADTEMSWKVLTDPPDVRFEQLDENVFLAELLRAVGA